MLRKLMKYDLKYYRKIMLPLWAVLIIYGIVHGINTVFNYETFYDHIPIKAQAIVVVTGIYFIFCVNIILVIQRFWKSMYEGSYLTRTLPVTERSWSCQRSSVRSSSVLQQFLSSLQKMIYWFIYKVLYITEKLHFKEYRFDIFRILQKQSCFNHSLYDHIWNHMDDASDLSAYTAICIGQMRSKNRFATMIIVGAFLFLVGYEMQVVLLQHNRYYSWFYLPCLIAFLVEIVLCHLVIEFILTRKLNIN